MVLIKSLLTEWPESYAVDTSNILFILSGAFVGLENIIRKRMAKGVCRSHPSSEPLTHLPHL